MKRNLESFKDDLLELQNENRGLRLELENCEDDLLELKSENRGLKEEILSLSTIGSNQTYWDPSSYEGGIVTKTDYYNILDRLTYEC